MVLQDCPWPNNPKASQSLWSQERTDEPGREMVSVNHAIFTGSYQALTLSRKGDRRPVLEGEKVAGRLKNEAMAQNGGGQLLVTR